jgi:pimeloyl-ACP methyl ester carboxylesterase
MTVIFPGIALQPAVYTTLQSELATRLGRPAYTYCPPGMGDRKGERGPSDPRDLARDALEVVPAAGDTPLLVGHSWGCHTARAVALLRGTPGCLVELDPRITPARRVGNVGSVPLGFGSRSELVAAYAAYGFAEDMIDWTWWSERGDGSFELAFDRDAVERYNAALTFTPPMETWRKLKGWRILLVVAGDHSSIRGEDLSRVRLQTPDVEILRLPHIAHRIPPEDQPEIAERLTNWLQARA